MAALTKAIGCLNYFSFSPIALYIILLTAKLQSPPTRLLQYSAFVICITISKICMSSDLFISFSHIKDTIIIHTTKAFYHFYL